MLVNPRLCISITMSIVDWVTLLSSISNLTKILLFDAILVIFSMFSNACFSSINNPKAVGLREIFASISSAMIASKAL